MLRPNYFHTLYKRWCEATSILVFLSLIIFVTGTKLHAQVENGVNGSVTDSNGAVVPDARVTIANKSTGVSTTVQTNSAGSFTVVGLLPGRYSVQIEKENFKTIHTDVTVEVARMSSLNLQLEVGAITESVDVEASAITLNTTSPSIGTTLEPELVKNAPIEIDGLARQIDSFIYLAPGVQGGPNSHNINGGVTYENEVQFNGVPVAFVQFEGNQTSFNPPYEAVSEFRVNSSTFDAQYGIGQGAVTFNMASGTNTFHGDGFEILRNQLFDSDGFVPTRFDAKGKPEPPENHENNYGFSVGGPVWIPKVYKGQNRTFFHFSGDWFRQNQAQTSPGTVPTKAMKSGDFSSYVDASGNVIPIYDPATGKPFPGNIIPDDRISANTKSLLQYIPDPDRAGVRAGLQSNKLPAVSSVAIKQFLWAYTIDHTISSSQSIHFTQWHDKVTAPYFTSQPIVNSSNPLQAEVNNQNVGSGFLLNYAKTITPNLVVTFGADAIGVVTGQHNANQKVNFAAVEEGVTLPLITFGDSQGLTSFGVSGGAYLNCCEGGLTDNNNRTLGIVGANNWLWTHGAHTFNFGTQIQRTFQNTLNCNFCSGTLNFNQRNTSTPDSEDPNFGSYGSAFASFLLGQVDSGERIFANLLRMRNKAFAFYAQDNYKITPKLTLNLGLRWDILVPFTEDHNDILFVDRTALNPAAGNLPGAVTKFGHCSGCAGITRADIHWKNLQPRLGFSYQLNKKTVVQSGFYMSYLNGGAHEYGTSFAASFLSTLLDGSYLRQSTNSSVPGYGNWDTQILPHPSQAPFSPSIGNAGVVFDFPYRNDNHFPNLPNSPSVGTAPYQMAWSARIERELPWDMFVALGYVGNRAIHLPTTLELSNQPNPSVLKYGSLLGKNILDPAVVAAGFTEPYPGFASDFGGGAILEQALTPYPQFGGFYPVYEMDGTAFYNAFQAQAEKRFTGGLSYLANVTISRNIANTAIGSGPYSPNGMNAYNPAPEYVPSYLDQLYLIKIVGTYALPFGKGKPFLNHSNVLSQIVGGWQVSGIGVWSGGTALGVANYNFNPLLVNGFDRPNIVPGAKLKTYSYKRSKDFFTGKTPIQPVQFTTEAFSNTGPWELGNAKRAYSELRSAPGAYENFDAIKSFSLGGNAKLSIRVDYFNAFNHTQLQTPDLNPADSTFGQITNPASTVSNRQGQATFRVEF